MRVYGLEHVERVSHERPLLLVANHRSFFDMYVVSDRPLPPDALAQAALLPRARPLLLRLAGGLLVNLRDGLVVDVPALLRGRRQPEGREARVRQVLDAPARRAMPRGRGQRHRLSPRRHAQQERQTPTRSFAPQPGVGKLIKEARPQVIPVFIAGLGNDLARQVLGNWRGGEPVRVHFGPRSTSRTSTTGGLASAPTRRSADFVMSKIAELGEQDRARIDRASKQVATLPRASRVDEAPTRERREPLRETSCTVDDSRTGCKPQSKI